jgi:type II secretory pathway component PulF
MKEVRNPSAWTWVAFLLLALVQAFLLLKIVPVFADIYEGFGARLPAPTQFVIQLSKFLGRWFMVLSPPLSVAVGGACVVMWYRPTRLTRTLFPLLMFLIIVLTMVACYLPVFRLAAQDQ